jgi:hypothetical protein
MMSAAMRAPLPVLGAALNVTVPEPSPAPGPATTIQSAVVTALHAQPDVVTTLTSPAPPLAGIVWFGGDTANVQPVTGAGGVGTGGVGLGGAGPGGVGAGDSGVGGGGAGGWGPGAPGPAGGDGPPGGDADGGSCTTV